jgi:hypothetical protein
LGVEGWCTTYLDELETPEALDLRKRYQLFGKADLDPNPAPPAGSPMAKSV